MKLEKVKVHISLFFNTISDLIVWMFITFLLPLVQLGFTLYIKNPTSEINTSVYNILFVTIASFLTNIFFFTEFWKKKNSWMKIILIFSYVIAFALFLCSLIEMLKNIKIFDLYIYKSGMIISLLLAIITGFSSKYDENLNSATL